MKPNGDQRHEHGATRRGGKRLATTIGGTVYPADWNEQGQVTAFDLVTGDDQVLRIRNSDKFVDYQEAYIEAQGIIEKQHRAGKSIFIKRFQVVQT
jgi:hypothetical protein